MSLPRYGEYKDSGVAWLGAVPRHWEIQRFKWLIARNDGGVWGDDPDGTDDTIVLRSTEQTVDGQWQIEEPAKRRLSEKDRLSAMLGVGDLLLTKSSGSALHIGKTTLVDSQVAELGACYSNFMQRIRVRTGMSPKLAWYILNNGLARMQLDLLSNSTTGLANLNGTIIGELLLAVAPHEEQATIAAFLDRETAKIDALIAEQEKLIALLAEKRQATISHAVTRGLDPHAPMKDSGVAWLGEVPAHWEVGKIQNFARRESGHTPSRQHPEYWENCTIPWFSLADVHQIRDGRTKYVSATKELVSELGLANSSARLLPKGTVILSRTASVGYSAIMDVAMATTQDFVNWICTGNLLPEYLLLVLRGMKVEFDRLMMGSTHQTIYMPDVAKLMMAKPPVEEQRSIVAVLDRTLATQDELTDNASRAVCLLKERRSALIAAAVTGQIDVRGVVSAKEPA